MEQKKAIHDELMKSAEAEEMMKLGFIMHGYDKEKRAMLEESDNEGDKNE